MKKRVFALLFGSLLTLSLCACGGENTGEDVALSTFTPEQVCNLFANNVLTDSSGVAELLDLKISDPETQGNDCILYVEASGKESGSLTVTGDENGKTKSAVLSGDSATTQYYKELLSALGLGQEIADYIDQTWTDDGYTGQEWEKDGIHIIYDIKGNENIGYSSVMTISAAG